MLQPQVHMWLLESFDAVPDLLYCGCCLPLLHLHGIWFCIVLRDARTLKRDLVLLSAP